jgi:UrcA family protein
MNIFTIAASAALIAAGFTCSAVIAQESPTSVRVSYADLNLSSSAGRNMLEVRINAAASKACAGYDGDRDLALKAESARCYAAAVSGARTAIAMATAPALASR